MRIRIRILAVKRNVLTRRLRFTMLLTLSIVKLNYSTLYSIGNELVNKNAIKLSSKWLSFTAVLSIYSYTVYTQDITTVYS